EVKNVSVIGIDTQTLAYAATRLIASHAKFNRVDAPGLPAVRRPDDGSRRGVIHTNRRKHHLGVVVVERDTFNTEIVSVGEIILQRYPTLARMIPPIDPTYVGAYVCQITRGTAEDDSRGKSASTNADVMPGIRLLAGSGALEHQEHCSCVPRYTDGSAHWSFLLRVTMSAPL